MNQSIENRLTDEQQLLVSSVEQIAEQEFTDQAFTWQGEHPWENIETLAEHGFIGVNFDEKYGGGGMTEYEAVLLIEALSQYCPDTADVVYSLHLVGPLSVHELGSESVKEEYLPRVTSGDTRIGIAISEPEAGSDAQSMTTAAEPEGDGYVLSGEKTWLSGMSDSSAVVLWAQFPDGMGSLLLDLEADGVRCGEDFTNMAGHTQTQLFLDDVYVPDEHVLVHGSQFKEQLRALNWERVGSSTLATGIATCAFSKAYEYSRDRTQFDQPIGDFQGIGWKLADMLKRIEASRALTHSAARDAVREGRAPTRLSASIAKLHSSEMVEAVVSEALQIHGANGYMKGHELEYLYRLARGRRIAAGTDEIQKEGIVAELERGSHPATRS
ncbi:acyl-CoA dehydrogenase family protein [Natrarchaeobius chitinivorans]|uniref:Acyl-CoA dehydrogenase n=1 Tax=Natrarchaeobius chitinivorans TaxID=1679083 RepID=A0A3N6MFE2_NATCH|nr:acyl-CoA dehydrogenase family protein [Natrarchaeobius chitinivorans]RQG95440.1 acyl-CoA dehydrogenase [Natrarchaeobius chitinivorans]